MQFAQLGICSSRSGSQLLRRIGRAQSTTTSHSSGCGDEPQRWSRQARYFRVGYYRSLILVAILFFPMWAFGAARPCVEIDTNFGKIVVELYPDKAPKTVENFLEYVETGFYRDTIFHRIVPRFMIQGGGFTEDYKQKATRAPIQNEANNGLMNQPGTIAMARTYDPHSATAQFFINVQDNKFLNFYKPHPDYYGYTVFGKVIKGQEVVEQISAVSTGKAGPFDSDVPLKPVIIEDMAVVERPVGMAADDSSVATPAPPPMVKKPSKAKSKKSVKKSTKK